MSKPLSICILLTISGLLAQNTTITIEGDWTGTLQADIPLHLVLHLHSGSNGKLAGTIDSVDQGANGIPLTSATWDGAKLALNLESIGATYHGVFHPENTTISGAWNQGGAAMPLSFERYRSASQLERRRPQNPVKPYPYREEELTVANDAAHVALAGTLTIPQGNGPFPAVVLITGSGPQDRNESLMGHQPFLVLSDYLTRLGIAVLRVDDRGFGKSTGNFQSATSEDFANDAEAEFEYLRKRPEVDAHSVGLIGHSEGGMIAPIVAARNSHVAFIVMLAGTGVRGDRILESQARLLSQAAGATRDQVDANVAAQRKILDGKIDSPWLRYFIAYDPVPTLRKVKCPVLALGGEKDLQVPADENLDAIRKAFNESGNRRATVEKLPGLNHLFQTAKTGAVGEYASIEETMSLLALDRIAKWILSLKP